MSSTIMEASAAGLLKLPNELLLDITDLLEAIGDLNALVKTNHHMYSALSHALYRREAKTGKGTALHWAAERGLTRTATLSLAEGTDVDSINSRSRDHIGPGILACDYSVTTLHLTPLQVAIAYRHEDLAVLLVKHGANVKVKYRGITTLHMASGAGLVSLMELIMERGVRVGTRDRAGQTPLHHAVRPVLYQYTLGRLKPIALLLQHGASVTARDNGGRTPEVWLKDGKTHGWSSCIKWCERLGWRKGRDRDDFASGCKEDVMTEEMRVTELLEAARAAIEVQKVEKARTKKKTRQMAQEQARVARARKEGGLRVQKMKEDAAQDLQREQKAEEQRKVQEARDAAKKAERERLQQIEKVELESKGTEKQAASAAAWAQFRQKANSTKR